MRLADGFALKQDHGVGADYQGVGMTGGDGVGFQQGVDKRHFLGRGGAFELLDLRGYRLKRDSQRTEEFAAAGGFRSEQKPTHCRHFFPSAWPVPLP